jgi:hypothetical protein
MAQEQVARAGAAATDLVCRFRAIASMLISLLKPPASPLQCPASWVSRRPRRTRRVLLQLFLAPRASPQPYRLQQVSLEPSQAPRVLFAPRQEQPALLRQEQLLVESQPVARSVSQLVARRSAQQQEQSRQAAQP